MDVGAAGGALLVVKGSLDESVGEGESAVPEIRDDRGPGGRLKVIEHAGRVRSERSGQDIEIEVTADDRCNGKCMGSQRSEV
jgi:hypothetical protein